MILKRRASLDRVQLDEIDGRILIQGIEPAAGKDQMNTVSLWGGDGSRVTGEHRDTLDVVIKFSLDIKRDAFEERSEIFEKVMAWAVGGGWLRVSTKPNRKLRVIAAQLPAEGDALEWTNRYSITFRAHGVPFWQDEYTENVRAASVSSLSRSFNVGGSARTVMEASFQNTSGSTINSFTLSCGGSTIQLSSLGLANGETLVIDHADDGRRCVLRIRIRGTGGSYRSALDKRTAASSADLWVKPGNIAVSLSAGGAGTLLLSCTGRFA
jgi:hypothetical protein